MTTCLIHVVITFHVSRFRILRPRALEQVGGDNYALYLRGTFVYLGDLGVSEETLDRIFFHVAIAAVDLHSGPGAFHRKLGGEELGDAGLFADTLALVFHGGGAIEEKA